MEIIESSKKEWLAADYHVFYHNCCHYSAYLCQRFGVAPVPGWITSLPHLVGACVTQDCCVPSPKEEQRGTKRIDADKPDKLCECDMSECSTYPVIGQLPATTDYYDLWKAEFG